MAATTTLPVLFGTGVHASRPAASAVGAGGLYSCTTHSLIYQTDGVSTWSTWGTLGGSAVTDATITTTDVTTNNVSITKHGWAPKAPNDATKYLDGTGAYTVPAGSGGSDLVQVASGAGSVRIPRLVSDPGVVPASPATNDAEFDSGTIPSGWSLHNAPANVDYNTTRKSCLYLKSANTSEGWAGIYVTSLPSTPFTLTIAVLGFQSTADYQKAGLFVSNGATGAHEAVQVGRHGAERRVAYEGYGSNTAAGGGSTAAIDNIWVPVYLRIKVNTTTSVDYSWSMDGYIWRSMVAARNPGFTISRIGIAVKQESTSTQTELLVDSARFS
jgi:hypothetical protein